MVCEPFELWVLEDHFSLGRPPFEDAGVQLVEDVEPYELMKLRLLNASHQGMCYFGYLAGYRYAHEVAQDGLFAEFLLDYMDKEATPTLQPVPGIDLDAFKRTLIERFSNEHVRHPGQAVRGKLGPDPQMAGPGDPHQPRTGRPD